MHFKGSSLFQGVMVLRICMSESSPCWVWALSWVDRRQLEAAALSGREWQWENARGRYLHLLRLSMWAGPAAAVDEDSLNMDLLWAENLFVLPSLLE